MQDKRTRKFGDFISNVKNDYLLGKDISYLEKIYIYSSIDEIRKECFRFDAVCIIGNSPSVEHGKDVLPANIIEMGFGIYCEGFALKEIIEGVLTQKQLATEQDLVSSLNYYYTHDGMLSWNDEEDKKDVPISQICLFPSIDETFLKNSIHRMKPSLLSSCKILNYNNGTILIAYSRDSDSLSVTSRLSMGGKWSLYLSFIENGWIHYLFHNTIPASPSKRVGKKVGSGVEPNIIAFTDAFPYVEKESIKKYFCSEDSYEKGGLVLRNNKYYATKDDKYPCGDWRQAIDFLALLGYPLNLYLVLKK